MYKTIFVHGKYDYQDFVGAVDAAIGEFAQTWYGRESLVQVTPTYTAKDGYSAMIIFKMS